MGSIPILVGLLRTYRLMVGRRRRFLNMKTRRVIETKRNDGTYDYLVTTLTLGKDSVLVDDVHTTRKVSLEELYEFLNR